MQTSYLVILAVFGVVSAALYYVLAVALQPRAVDRTRLEGLSGGAPVSRTVAAPPASRREALQRADRELRRFDQYSAVELALERAGWRLRPLEFGVAAVAVTVTAGFLGAYLLKGVLWGVLVAVMAAGLAPLSLLVARGVRMARFEAHLPDALELMAASLRSGHGFQRALQVTAEDMPCPVSDEFRMAVQDINVGQSVEEALRGILTRVPSYEMELIATAVGIQLQVGGNLSEILQKIAETLRERARIRGEIATLTAEGKLSAIIVFLMPILLFFYLMSVSPDYMRPLVSEDFGRLLLLVAAVMECIGMVVIWKLVSMEV